MNLLRGWSLSGGSLRDCRRDDLVKEFVKNRYALLLDEILLDGFTKQMFVEIFCQF